MEGIEQTQTQTQSVFTFGYKPHGTEGYLFVQEFPTRGDAEQTHELYRDNEYTLTRIYEGEVRNNLSFLASRDGFEYIDGAAPVVTKRFSVTLTATLTVEIEREVSRDEYIDSDDILEEAREALDDNYWNLSSEFEVDDLEEIGEVE